MLTSLLTFAGAHPILAFLLALLSSELLFWLGVAIIALIAVVKDKD